MRMPWHRAPQLKPGQPPVELLTPLAVTWLLATLALAVAPHANELPLWLTPLFYAIVGWRGFIAIRGNPHKC